MPSPSQPTLATVADGLPGPRRAQAMAAILIAVAFATLDLALVNIALPSIAEDLGTGEASAIWIVNAYQLVMLAALLPLASLGETLGYRRIYVAGLALFTLTSLACGMAWSLPTLVAARALQGLGAAAIMSVNTALIRFIYPSSRLGRGIGLNALIVALAFTAGPSVASALLTVASWQWLFLINVPAGALAFVLARRALPVTERASHRLDLVAALLCAGFFAFLILGIGDAAQQTPWPRVLGELTVALVCCVALIRREAGHPAPLLAVDLMRLPVFSLSALTSICSFSTQGLAFVALPFLLQNVMGHSAVITGLLITPWPAMVMLMSPIGGRLADRYPVGVLGSIGMLTMAVGMAALALLPDTPPTLAIVWPMALCGIGFGFFQAPNMRAIMSSVPPARSGAASGVVAGARLLGQTLGAALVALCFHIAQPNQGPELALWLGCGFAAVGSVTSVARLLARSHRPHR